MWGEEFSEGFSQIDNFNSRVAADMVMAYCNKVILKQFIKIFGNILTKESIEKSDTHKSLKIFADNFIEGMGFSMITVRKRD